MSDGTSIPVPLLSGGLTVLKLTTVTLIAAIWQPARAALFKASGRLRSESVSAQVSYKLDAIKGCGGDKGLSNENDMMLHRMALGSVCLRPPPWRARAAALRNAGQREHTIKWLSCHLPACVESGARAETGNQCWYEVLASARAILH